MTVQEESQSLSTRVQTTTVNNCTTSNFCMLVAKCMKNLDRPFRSFFRGKLSRTFRLFSTPKQFEEKVGPSTVSSWISRLFSSHFSSTTTVKSILFASFGSLWQRISSRLSELLQFTARSKFKMAKLVIRARATSSHPSQQVFAKFCPIWPTINCNPAILSHRQSA